MSRGFVINSGSVKHRGSFIVRTALVLSIIAAILIGIIGLTVNSANTLMNIDRNYVSNVPSNILPSYSTTSFESADGQTALSGWFFKTADPISTVIVVHDTGSNRLPFGVNMIDMVETWLDNRYNVFLFDQRNSGDSSGDISGYGYLEWKDVLGAIAIVKQISLTTDVVLYGIGTGCTSSVLAYNNLPEPGAPEDEYVFNLTFDKSYIAGMIFDSPAKSSVKMSFSALLPRILFLMPSRVLPEGIPLILLLRSQDFRFPYALSTEVTIHLSEQRR